VYVYELEIITLAWIQNKMNFSLDSAYSFYYNTISYVMSKRNEANFLDQCCININTESMFLNLYKFVKFNKNINYRPNI